MTREWRFMCVSSETNEERNQSLRPHSTSNLTADNFMYLISPQDCGVIHLIPDINPTLEGSFSMYTTLVHLDLGGRSKIKFLLFAPQRIHFLILFNVMIKMV